MIRRTKGGTLLSQTQQVCQRVWNKILRDLGMEDLEGARGRIIFALWGQNGVQIKTLCEKTSLDKSTLTGILNRLERDGYIYKEQDPSDKRSTLIYLTGKDQAFSGNVDKASDVMNHIFYKGLTDDEILQFESLLGRILENCKEADELNKRKQ